MAIQLSEAVRNARGDAYETAIGASPKLQLRTGAPPANCAAAATGTLLAELTLPADWLGAAAAGVKSKSGTWSGTGVADGEAGHYRILDSTGTTCHEQGTASDTGTPDLDLDNADIATGQTVTISSFSKTEPNS